MTELEVAQAIARGELPSPQKVAGFWLFAMRWSGTGQAWREARSEHVFRPEEQYCTPEMCARIAGVPVVAVHPKAGILDSKSYVNTVVGAIAFGYIAGGDGIESPTGAECWCIARINDAHAAAAMETGKFSTSPAVVFAPGENNRLDLSDGSHVLIEGKPAIVDHLAALIAEGVWDKGGDPTGIRTDAKEVNMGTENQTQVDKTLDPESVDKRFTELHDKMTKIADQIAAMMHGNDSARRHDDDARRRADADREEEEADWRREDAAQCARDDAAEEEDRTKLREAGEAEEVARDKARQIRRDKVRRRRADAALRRSAADAERERHEEHERVDAQARCDTVARQFGWEAPPPMQSEKPLNYRRRLVRKYQKFSPTFKDADLDSIHDSVAFAGIEAAIYADAAKASATHDIPAVGLLERRRTDQHSGHRIVEFVGNHTFISDLKPPAMYVTAFHARAPGHAA